MTVTQLVGRNIRKWREFRGMKQEVLAKLLNLSKSGLSQIENGKTDVTVSRLESISRILEIEMILLINIGWQPGNQSDLLETLKSQLDGKDRLINLLQSMVHQEPGNEKSFQTV